MFLMKRHAHFNIPEPECFGHFWGPAFPLRKNHRPILPQVTVELPTAKRSLQPTVGRQKPWPRGKPKRWNFVRNPKKSNLESRLCFFFKATMCWVLRVFCCPKKIGHLEGVPGNAFWDHFSMLVVFLQPILKICYMSS